MERMSTSWNAIRPYLRQEKKKERERKARASVQPHCILTAPLRWHRRTKTVNDFLLERV